MVAPAVPAARIKGLPLTPEAIRERLARPAPPPDPRDQHLTPLKKGMQPTHAAVLVPLVRHATHVSLLLTQRTDHLDDHAGQISFPGGRVELADASREDTALREAEEEIGLARTVVRVLGRLPEHEMSSGFLITPVVGWIESPLALKADPFEVASVFEVPLEHFLDPANYQRRQYRLGDRHRHYLAVPYQRRYVWGATAGMLYMLCRMLRA